MNMKLVFFNARLARRYRRPMFVRREVHLQEGEYNGHNCKQRRRSDGLQCFSYCHQDAE